MLTKRIIPCLDVTDGRVKKGVNFVNLVDVGDPVAIARRYQEQGADELVFLDITATNQGRQATVDMVAAVSRQVFMPLTVGGGIRSVEDMRALLLAGADKVSLNSSAVANPDLISAGARLFGNQCLVTAIDVKTDPATGQKMVYTHGGTKPTGLEPRGACLGQAGRFPGLGGAPGHFDGQGRHPEWLRHRLLQGTNGGRRRAGDRLRGGREDR